MASAKSTAICFFLTMMGLFLLEKMKMGLCCGVSKSIPSVHVVGDSKRWTSLGHVDYTDWACTKNFHVDDALRRLLVPLLFFSFLSIGFYIVGNCQGKLTLLSDFLHICMLNLIRPKFIVYIDVTLF